ncbi:hypothetical protein J4N42_19795 [Vibrio sp. SCSIO 43135]|uniref:hypothetical protein n=1 Tax=Vibrio sp. SCSIO 43135 TaxID=2819096 RepID=UPI002075E2E6|nr:hypothetical protein [Vibrio sp. SCSIO 43135]USD42859.1 hypothetical protein J4N42_19795 [Vibrio sp. SCSIO 43135]
MKMNKLTLAISLLFPVTGYAAFNDAGTDYSNAEVRSHVWNEALEPIELVNSILCFTAQFNSVEFANAGPYAVLADEAACFDDEDDGSSGQSSGASNAVSYMKAISNVTRADDSSPLIVNVWLPEMEAGDDDQAIKFKAEISEGASDSNPFGSFTFNFDFYDSFSAGNQAGGGEVITVDTVDGSIGFTLYESSTRGSETYEQSASVVMASDRSSGIALTGFDQGSNGQQSFALAFNTTHVLMQSVNGGFSSLPYKNGVNSGTCLSRTEFDSYVHRYDLFNASTGAQIELNSGFPIKYDSDSDGNYDSYGFIGYWGLWTEQDGAISDGDTLVSDNGGTETSYTYVNAPGRLIKNSVKTLTLANARGVDFSYWDDDIFNDNDYDQWVVNYLTVADDSVGADGFYKTGKLKWGNNGPEITSQTPSLISLASYDSLYMFSDQLGGEVKYLEGQSALTYYEQTFINGSETGSGELLESGSVTLTCHDNCPIGTFELSDLSEFSGANSPFETGSGPYTYTFATSGSNSLTLVSVSSSEAVQYQSSLTQSDIDNTPHNWGVRSGPMIIGSVSNSYDIYDPSVVTEFYVWETGIQSWNQLSTVADGNGDVVSFERPLQVSYQHSSANDRSGDAGDYDGQTFLINYGGNGDLWGIPMDENSTRYRPAFSLADGVLLGSSNQYVVKAIEIEQTMQSATGECSALVLQDPAVDVPTSVQGDADIGDMPEVTDDPAVIAGVTQ